MSFPKLNSEVLELRRALQDYVGAQALGEIRLSHPASNSDEASFLRLTSWCYVLLFEAGRVSIRFLLELPNGESGADKNLRDNLRNVHSLRTFCFHNLGLTDRDKQLSRRARDWQREKCGTDTPKRRRDWRNCFRSLCAEVNEVIEHCHGAVDNVLASPMDGQGAIAELRKRLDRNWPAHKFDGLVGDVLVRLGPENGLKIPAFRERHLQKWRDYLEFLPEGEDVETMIIRVIERDVLNHFDGVLPIDGRDIMELGIPQGPLVKLALHKAREHMLDGNKSRDELLNLIGNDPLLQNDNP